MTKYEILPNQKQDREKAIAMIKKAGNLARRISRDYIAASKKCLDFSGKSTRIEFFNWIAGNIAILIAWTAIMTPLLEIKQPFIEQFLKVAAGTILGLYICFFAIAQIALTCRRLRDGGHSPWWVLIGLIPIPIFLLVPAYMVCFYGSESR